MGWEGRQYLTRYLDRGRLQRTRYTNSLNHLIQPGASNPPPKRLNDHPYVVDGPLTPPDRRTQARFRHPSPDRRAPVDRRSTTGLLCAAANPAPCSDARPSAAPPPPSRDTMNGHVTNSPVLKTECWPGEVTASAPPIACPPLRETSLRQKPCALPSPAGWPNVAIDGRRARYSRRLSCERGGRPGRGDLAGSTLHQDPTARTQKSSLPPRNRARSGRSATGRQSRSGDTGPPRLVGILLLGLPKWLASGNVPASYESPAMMPLISRVIKV
jgi:hypothetical protein